MPIYYCDGKRLKRAIWASASWLTQNKEVVNSLNVFPVPDGDTGTNMSLTLHKVLEGLEDVNSDHLPTVAQIIAETSLWGARGCSGVILSQILRGFAEGIGNKQRIGCTDIAQCLGISAQMAYSAIDKPAEGTILTLLREIAESSVELAKREKDIVNLLNHILKVGEHTLVRTRGLLPQLKRANVIDAGGKGFLFMIEGILKLIEGSDFKDCVKAVSRPIIQKEEMEQRYCLDFVVLGGQQDLKKRLESLGKDIVIASSSNLTKVHIHTNDPDKIIEIAKNYGKVEQIKIDDIEDQHSQFTEIGIIAVVSGDGISKIFRDLNAHIVEGGQTMNPTVAQIKSAITKIGAEKVILLPNNPNIIAVAKKAGEISRKEVQIIPTKTIPEGIAALTSFSSEKSFYENIKCMKEAISGVKSGEVTRAIRDAEIEGLKIRKGDYIGIYNHSLKVSSKEEIVALISLLKAMVEEDDSLISIFYSSKATDKEELYMKLSREFPEFDIEIHYGGQPNYDYIVSVE